MACNIKATDLPCRVLKAIKLKIREELHLIASAGVSYNKFLAKIASDYRKPDGLCTIHPSQAEEFIKLLGQAHDEIRKAIAGKNITAAADLLVQCQEGAVELGNLIEQVEGDTAPAIPLLEQYCERVYQVHQEMTEQGMDADKAHKNCANPSFRRKQHTE